MIFEKTAIEGLLIITPDVFKDDRGYFYESYSESKFREAGIDTVFVQDNESMSGKNVLRGLHFQKPPFAQAKLVRVVQGAVIDVAVDIRKKSPTFGQHLSVLLTAENKKMFYIPEGFAHGFVVLEDQTIFDYKCSRLFNKASEGAIRWNDPNLKIDWSCETPILSEKDKLNPLLEDYLKTNDGF